MLKWKPSRRTQNQCRSHCLFRWESVRTVVSRVLRRESMGMGSDIGLRLRRHLEMRSRSNCVTLIFSNVKSLRILSLPSIYRVHEKGTKIRMMILEHLSQTRHLLWSGPQLVRTNLRRIGGHRKRLATIENQVQRTWPGGKSFAHESYPQPVLYTV